MHHAANSTGPERSAPRRLCAVAAALLCAGAAAQSASLTAAPKDAGSPGGARSGGGSGGARTGSFSAGDRKGPSPTVVDRFAETAVPKPPAPRRPDDAGVRPAVLPATADDDPSPGVRVSEQMTVDMHLADESLANVLQMLAMQCQRNIVASKDVSATVSANLYGVTLYEALDAVLHVNGYGYLERGNFIYVYTLEELEQLRQAERRPIAKLITLNYLNANDAAQFVVPLLSEIGQIKTNGDVEAFNVGATPQGDERFALSATLVVFDYPENVQEIERLVRQLDTRPAQVLVEATILEARVTENNAFGVDFSVIGSLNFSDFVTAGPLGAFSGIRNPTATTAGNRTGTAVVGGPGNTGGDGTLKVGVVDDNVSVFVRLLDSVADTNVISNPKILALNRQPAKVLVGERLGYLSTTATETATTQTVEFLDTGTQLVFRPFVSNDGMIRMELKPSVSNGSIRNATGPNGTVTSIPDELTNEVTTNVLVRDGSTIVLGGLFKETTTLARRQIPVLGDIPIIGAPFRGHDDQVQRVEIIFLITPTIVTDRSLAEAGEKAAAWTEHVRTGTRQGLLPWSRESMTARLNVEAEELARKGDSEGALWRLRRSLELNPNQPEAVRMRAALTARRDNWPSRSLLDDILREQGAKAPARPGPPAVTQPGRAPGPGDNGAADPPPEPAPASLDSMMTEWFQHKTADGHAAGDGGEP